MFCTSLRRRSSFAAAIPSLISASIKESQLETHDIALPLPEFPQIGHASQQKRTLRLLLLSPNSMSKAKLPDTLSRIQHFASLTGGVDVAIVMSLTTSKPFASARNLLAPSEDNSEGISSYANLQSELMTRSDLPWIHILPLANLDGLVELIKTHSQAISRPKPKPSSAVRPLDMLAHCSTEPPLSSLAVNLTADMFPSLNHLVQAALAYQATPPSSVRVLQDDSSSDEVLRSDEISKAAFAVLAEQLTNNVVDGMVEFWKDDFIIE